MLLRQTGHIVTISSMAGYVGINRMPDYCASKFAAVGFSEALTAELTVGLFFNFSQFLQYFSEYCKIEPLLDRTMCIVFH